MDYFKKLLRNIGLLLIIGIVLLMLSPSIMGQVYNFFGALFGPLVILMIIAIALPKRGKRN